MKRTALLMGLSALTVYALAMPAHANTPKGAAATGLKDLTELNLIVIGNMNASADVEGKAYIGGNLNNAATTGIGSTANPTQGFTQSAFPTLTVGGNLSGSLNLNDGPNGKTGKTISPYGATIGGNVYTVNTNGVGAVLQVGGSISTININDKTETITAGGGVGDNGHTNGATVASNVTGYQATLQSSLNAQTATFVSDLNTLSAALDALDGGVSTAGSSFSVKDPNNATFTVTNADTLGYAVIDINASALESAKNLDFDLLKVGNGYLPTVINVTGATDYDLTNMNSNDKAIAPYVIWNFVGAKSIKTIQFNGSLLAPLATLQNNSPINGAVAVDTFNAGGEVHLGTFAGDPALTKALGGVPEPATWMMMIGGVSLVGAALRRRRSLAPAARLA